MACVAFGAEGVYAPIGDNGAFIAPASREQSRLWFLGQERTNDAGYNMAYLLRVQGALAPELVEAALGHLQKRHEILRTSFTTVDGAVQQVIHAEGVVHLERFDLTDASSTERESLARTLANDIAKEPFSLAALPLMRCRYIKMSPEESRLVVVMHHIIGDGWSHAVLTRDFCHYYNALAEGVEPSLPPLAVQYSDYAAWQDGAEIRTQLALQAERWLDALYDVPELSLPRDPETHDAEAELGHHAFVLDEDLVQRLNRYARAKGLLLSAVLLAANQKALAVLCRQDSFLMGTVVANRPLPQLEELIGFFANTLALHSEANEAETADALVRNAQSQLLSVQEHQSAPFDQVVNALRKSRGSSAPIGLNALFVLQNAPYEAIRLGGYAVETEKLRVGRAKFPFTLFATEEGGRLRMDIEYAPDRVSIAFARAFEGVFRRWLESLAGVDSARAPDAPSIVHGECRPDLLGSTVIEQIWCRAQETPQATAMVDGQRRWSYAELIGAAEALAARMLQAGMQRGDVVCTCLPRSAELMVALLGIMRAGMVWAPIDPDAPSSYNEDIIASASPKLLLGQPVGSVPSLEVLLGEDQAVRAFRHDFPKCHDVGALFHTSGSTGRPKGVLIRHEGLANVCCWIREELGITAESRGLWKTVITFDAVCRELFPILIGGGTLFVAPPDSERDMALLRDSLEAFAISALHCVPTQLRALLACTPWPESVRAVMSGGEALSVDLARDLLAKGIALYNVYGPTETSVDVTCHPVVDVDQSWEVIPLGQPLPNVAMAILGDGGIVPAGARGEIFIAGPQVAAGYVDTALDARFGIVEGLGRGYYTGDMGYVSSDGRIHFSGRIDRQIKWNGIRIELGAVESAFRNHAYVQDAHVELTNGDRGNPELTAFITPSSRLPVATAELEGNDWDEIFGNAYDGLDYDVEPRDNTQGWVDSATRHPIPPQEVLDACQRAAERILRWQPKRVLELGCGIGTLSYRLIERCERFVGVDFSQSAIDYARQHLAPQQREKARFEASRIETFDGGGEAPFDAIVLNSVVQYLDSKESLNALLDRFASWLSPNGFIFVGDVRDARLESLHALWKARHRSDQAETCSSVLLAAHVDRLMDEELRLAPEFFACWAERHGYVAPLVELKDAAGENELVRFRFDATLAVAPREAAPPQAAPLFRRYAYRPVREEQALQRAFRQAGDAISGRIEKEIAGQDHGVYPHSTLFDAAVAESGVRHFFFFGDRTAETFQRVSLPDDLSLAETCSACSALHDPCDMDATRSGGAGGVDSARWRLFVQSRTAIVDSVSARLPRGMRPARVIMLPYLPTRHSGKRDIRALLRLADRLEWRREGGAVSPEPGSLEAVVAETFSEVLGFAFYLDDNFFMRGGHSLLAAQARNRLQKRLHRTVPLRCMFDCPTPRTLAGFLRAETETGVIGAGPAKRPEGQALEASHAQQRLWFIERLGTGSPVYNIAHAVRIEGRINETALDQSIGELLRRHPALRSTFADVEGRPEVRLAPPRSYGNLERIGERASEADILEALDRQQRKRFDLERGPLVRFLLAETTRNETILCFIGHHIVSDGWSMTVALEELGELYDAKVAGRPARLKDISTDYFDLAYWEIEASRSGKFDEAIGRWRELLADAPRKLALPYDKVAPGRRSWSGDKLHFEIPEALGRQVRDFAASRNATEFMAYLAAFNVLLKVLTDQNDMVVGTVSANRTSVEHERVVGFMVNPLPIRTRLSFSDTFDSLLQRVRASCVDAFSLQEVPFEKLLEHLDVDRDSDYQAVFQVLFAMQNMSSGGVKLGGSSCHRIKLPAVGAMFDLSLEVLDRDGKFFGELEYSTELFESSTAVRMAQRYLACLRACLEQPGEPIEGMRILDAEERSKLLEWSRGPELAVDPDETLIGRFDRIAVANPDRPALDDGRNVLSYGELRLRIIDAAWRLRESGCRPKSVVAVMLPRGPMAALGMLACHWLGATPCYIDPMYPQSRRKAMLEACAASACLTDGSEEEGDTPRNIAIVPLPALHVDIDATIPAGLERPQTSPDDTAFIAFTSGSTGRPKLVAVSCRSTCARLEANDRLFGSLDHSDRFAHCYSFNYDGGLVCLFWPITRGAVIEFIELSVLGDPNALTAALVDRGITVFDSIPSVVAGLYAPAYADRLKKLRLVLTGGDACPSDLPQRHFQYCDAPFANQYGPCEAVINASTAVYRMDAVPEAATIGRPIPGCDIVIVDAREQLAPIGVPGELWIGGPFLADGYLGDEKTTGEKFVLRDFGNGAQIYYRSGDRGRWCDNGEIEFLGRMDRQIQLNGMRLELDEIEAEIGAHPMVRYSRVLEVKKQGRSTLAAFVTADAEAGGQTDVGQQWSEAFDSLYQSPCEREQDYTGWTDTATGEPIPEAEMAAWLDDTLCVLRSCKPKRVLEIGAGLGLIALTLSREVERYVATDISAAAVAALRAMQTERPALEVHHCPWSRLDTLLANQRFDLIVVNSVVQYLSGYDELRRLLCRLDALLTEDGKVLLGDVRDFDLRQAFYRQMLWKRDGRVLDRLVLSRRLEELESNDDELHVSPSGLLAIAAEVETWKWICFRRKPTTFANEMTTFRYDALLAKQHLSDRKSGSVEWSPSVHATLDDRISAMGPEGLRLVDVPYLHVDDKVQGVAIPFRSGYVEDIIAAAKRRNLGCHLSVGIKSDHCDVSLAKSADEPFQAARFEPARGRQFANVPTFGAFSRKLSGELRRHLEARVPRHMIPPVIKVLGEMPMRAGGKLDEERLLQLATTLESAGQRLFVEDIRYSLIEDIWCRLLDTRQANLSDDFFALGGHSLLATRFAAIVKRELGVSIPVIALFEARTFENIVNLIVDAAVASESVQPTEESEAAAHAWLEANQEAMSTYLAPLPPQSRHIAMLLSTAEPLHEQRLRDALERTRARHPAVGRHPSHDPSVAGHAHLPYAEAASVRAIAERPLDPAQDGGISVHIGQDGPGHAIAIRVSPLIFDGMSLEIFWREWLGDYFGSEEPVESELDASVCKLERAVSTKALRLHRALGTSSEGFRSAGTRALRASLRHEEVERLEEIARASNMTVPAVVLGLYAYALRRIEETESVRVDCSVDFRFRFGRSFAKAVGPFTREIPIRFEGAEDVDDYRMLAADGIAALLSDRRVAASQKGASPYAFSYRVQADSHSMRGSQKPRIVWADGPMWNAMKLSAVKTTEGLELVLRYNTDTIADATASATLASLVGDGPNV